MPAQPVSLCILGSTGSIGRTALRVVDAVPERFRVFALAARSNGEALLAQARKYRPLYCSLTDETAAGRFASAFRQLGIELLVGEVALVELVRMPQVDTVVSAVDGAAGLPPLVAAIEADKDIAFANKEALVAGGVLVKRLLEEHKVRFLPIDSEHSAILQCLAGGERREVKSITITASGGPFWNRSVDELRSATYEEVMRHPLWQMGRRNTVNSATFANKALEIVEAHFLFDLPGEAIGVLVHPQGIIHGMVEFVDGSILAQLAVPDMALPVQYALGAPARLPAVIDPLELAEIGTLEFHVWDEKRFPALALAYRALEGHWWEPVVLNAMNEALVDRFLSREISFWQLSRGLPLVFECREEAVVPIVAAGEPVPVLSAILEIDAAAREFAKRFPARELEV